MEDSNKKNNCSSDINGNIKVKYYVDYRRIGMRHMINQRQHIVARETNTF